VHHLNKPFRTRSSCLSTICRVPGAPDLQSARRAARPFLLGSLEACSPGGRRTPVHCLEAPCALAAQHIMHQLPQTTLEATQGQILNQSPTDATRFWWHLYGS